MGSWELSQQSYNHNPIKAPPGYFKVFNTDKTLVNMLTRYNKPVTTHGGTYKVDNKYYLERTLYRSPTMINNSPLGTDFTIKFEFSQDQT